MNSMSRWRANLRLTTITLLILGALSHCNERIQPEEVSNELLLLELLQNNPSISNDISFRLEMYDKVSKNAEICMEFSQAHRDKESDYTLYYKTVNERLVGSGLEFRPSLRQCDLLDISEQCDLKSFRGTTGKVSIYARSRGLDRIEEVSLAKGLLPTQDFSEFCNQMEATQ